MPNLCRQISGPGAAATGEAWMRICRRLRLEFGEDVFSSWFGCLELDALSDDDADLSVPTKFLKLDSIALYAQDSSGARQRIPHDQTGIDQCSFLDTASSLPCQWRPPRSYSLRRRGFGKRPKRHFIGVLLPDGGIRRDNAIFEKNDLDGGLRGGNSHGVAVGSPFNFLEFSRRFIQPARPCRGAESCFRDGEIDDFVLCRGGSMRDSLEKVGLTQSDKSVEIKRIVKQWVCRLPSSAGLSGRSSVRHWSPTWKAGCASNAPSSRAATISPRRWITCSNAGPRSPASSMMGVSASLTMPRNERCAE